MSTTPPPVPSSWSAEDAATVDESRGKGGGRKLVIVVVVVVGLALMVGAFALVQSRGMDPEERAWPPELDGRPFGLGEGAPPTDPADVTAGTGIYLWKDFEGWHLWAVNGTELPAVRGTITTDDGWAEGKLAAPDSGTVSVDEDVLTFELAGDVPVAGIDFEPGFYAKELIIDLQTDEGTLPASLVVAGGDTAEAIPIVITKDPVVDE